MNKQQVEQIIEALGEKGKNCNNCSFCLGDCVSYLQFKEHIHPVLIGDVLEKIGEADSDLLSNTQLQELTRKWNAR